MIPFIQWAKYAAIQHFTVCIFLGIFGLISEGGKKKDPTASLQQSPTCETCEDFSVPQNA